MSQVCLPDICSYCHWKIRFWQDWVGISHQEVGLQSFWKTRAHFVCWREENKN